MGQLQKVGDTAQARAAFAVGGQGGGAFGQTQARAWWPWALALAQRPRLPTPKGISLFSIIRTQKPATSTQKPVLRLKHTRPCTLRHPDIWRFRRSPQSFVATDNILVYGYETTKKSRPGPAFFSTFCKPTGARPFLLPAALLPRLRPRRQHRWHPAVAASSFLHRRAGQRPAGSWPATPFG